MNYTIRQVGGVTILDLTGHLSSKAVLGEPYAFGPRGEVLLSEAIRELTNQGQKNFLLNLAGVTYADSSGIGQLVSALTTVRNRGGDLKLLSPTAMLQNLLQTANLHTVFYRKDDEARAIQSFSQVTVAGG